MAWRTVISRVVLAFILVTGLAELGRGEDLSSRAAAAYANGDFDLAARLFAEAAARDVQNAGFLYNGACSAALAGDADLAFDLLGQAVTAGYADAGHLSTDSDLDSLHGDSRWDLVLDRVVRAEESLTAFWNNQALTSDYQETLDVDLRVAGLSKLWSEAKYNFANFDLVADLDFDRLYLETLPRVRTAKSTQEYYRILTEFLAALRDGHTYVSPPRPLADQLWARPALRTRRVEDRVLVLEVLDESLLEQGVRPGLEVVSVDGTAALDYGDQQIRPWQSASTPQDLESRTFERNFLTGVAGSMVTLQLRDSEGRTQEHQVRRLPSAERSRLLPRQPGFVLTPLSGNLLHIELNTFNDSSAYDGFLERFDRISQADGLILDLRDNGGGNSSWGWRILAMLTNEPVPTSQWDTRLYRPAFRAWGRAEAQHHSASGEWTADHQHLYSGPVVVLVSPRTYSAAEDFLVSFDTLDRGPILGQASGGSTGQPLVVGLPGGGSAKICSKRDRYPNGTEFVGVGVQPDIEVHPTVADFRAGRDTVLEKAVELLKP